MNEEDTWALLNRVVPITHREPMCMEHTVEWAPKTLTDYGSWLAYFEQALLGNGFTRGTTFTSDYFTYHTALGSVHMRMRCVQNGFWIRATYFKGQ